MSLKDYRGVEQPKVERQRDRLAKIGLRATRRRMKN
jgi:hypothetical protein